MLCVVKLSSLGECTCSETIGPKLTCYSIANHYLSTLCFSAAATAFHQCWRRCQTLPGMFIQVLAATEMLIRLRWRVHIRTLSIRFVVIPGVSLESCLLNVAHRFNFHKHSLALQSLCAKLVLP